MKSLWSVILLNMLLSLSACAASSQRVFEAGARTALAVMTDELTQQSTQLPCPHVHYRLPIVTRVTVPDTIVGGVLIPQHPTYVVLQSGAWQVVETDPLRQPGAPPVPPDCPSLHGGR